MSNQAFQAIRRNEKSAQGNSMPRSPGQNLTFPQLLEKSKNEIARALPKHLSPERMARIALTAFRNNDRLAQCEPMSVLAAVVQSMQLGLEIGMMGEAHLVPFKNRKGGYECQMIPGYTGLMKLARQSGLVADIYAHEVRENDHFRLRLGVARELEHEPLATKGGFPASTSARGEVTGFYAVCVFKDGTNTFVAMSVEDVCKVRDESNGYKMAKRYDNSTPWDTHFVPMGLKTAIRYLAKYLPKSPELAKALALDAAAADGQSQKIDLTQAADGAYEPVFEQSSQDDGSANADQKAQEASQASQGDQSRKEGPPAASSVRAEAPRQATAQAPAPATQHRFAQQAKQATGPVQDVSPKEGASQRTSAAQAPAPVQNKPQVRALDRFLDEMTKAKRLEDLNEAYIRAEAALSGADLDTIQHEYCVVKDRLDGAGTGSLFSHR